MLIAQYFEFIDNRVDFLLIITNLNCLAICCLTMNESIMMLILENSFNLSLIFSMMFPELTFFIKFYNFLLIKIQSKTQILL